MFGKATYFILFPFGKCGFHLSHLHFKIQNNPSWNTAIVSGSKESRLQLKKKMTSLDCP